MVATAPAAQAALTAAEPVPVAIAARTSTLALQDPVASVRRQIRACQAWLPAGWFIAAVYSDVESGATDLEKRSRTDSWRVLTDAGIPRDGGMADLLTEAASPSPRFAVVVCEDIERSARDTFNSIKMEKELSRYGIPLFATDEPADIAGVNSTTLLVRRVKQGVAEWYRLKLKEQTWKGFVEHNAEGWNIGPAPYGYAAQRHPHPSPVKASQGRTKTRLVTDPPAAPVVGQIYTWRTVQKLGVPTITSRLNAAPALYPTAPGTDGWTDGAVRAILANPKYTGHQVYGRRTRRNGRITPAPPEAWLWTPQPVHEPIISMETWKAAQQAGTEHATSRDPGTPGPATRTYVYRGRVRCRDCTKRMAGRPQPPHVYYTCPHKAANPRHAAAHPDHPRTVQVSETLLDAIAGRFFTERIFSPGRAALLAAQLPASDTEARNRRDTEAANLQAQVRKLSTQQDAQVTALEEIPAGSPAARDMRARINTRFAQLHQQRTSAETKLAALTGSRPQAADPAILDEVPYAGDIHTLPPDLKARLLDAFNLAIWWNKTDKQATVTAVITDTTLQALPAILDPAQDRYHDTATPQPTPAAMKELALPPITLITLYNAAKLARLRDR